MGVVMSIHFPYLFGAPVQFCLFDSNNFANHFFRKVCWTAVWFAGLFFETLDAFSEETLFPLVSGFCADTVFSTELGKTLFHFKRFKNEFKFLTHDIDLLPGHGQHLREIC